MRAWPRLHISGRAYLALAFWLLISPAQWVGAALAAACVHELGHLVGIWAYGGRVWEIHVDVFGAKMETEPLEQGAELICALAGPLAGGILCLFWRWIPRMAVCAAVQTAFNLLPIFPLDGGRALRAVRNICCKARGKRVQ